MTKSESKSINKSLVLTLRVAKENVDHFENWQSKLNNALADYSDFGSQEVMHSEQENESRWNILLRFKSEKGLESWIISESYRQILEEAEKLFKAESSTQADETNGVNLQDVTELITIRVKPGMNDSYARWAAKIQKVEASFKGFKGVYLQPPSTGTQNKWVTLLRFDTPQNLDSWLASSRRKDLLDETEEFVLSLDRHRVFSPFAGWFADASDGTNSPASWKQSMLVLMVLYPTIMLKMRFLSSYTADWPISISTFFGNALSIILLACLLMPLAVKILEWWLVPQTDRPLASNLKGLAIVVGVYILEIVLFGFLF